MVVWSAGPETMHLQINIFAFILIHSFSHFHLDQLPIGRLRMYKSSKAGHCIGWAPSANSFTVEKRWSRNDRIINVMANKNLFIIIFTNIQSKTTRMSLATNT